MIVIFKFESYLGGGETLVTRFAQYLRGKGIPFFVFCKKDSYIHKGLNDAGFDNTSFHAVERDCNYYYLNSGDRRELLQEFKDKIPQADEYKFITSSMRDLYMITDLCKSVKGSVTHLILHNQDHRYVCRSLPDVLFEKLGSKRAFHNKRALKCNRRILDRLNNNGSLIPMSYIITQLWKNEIGITIPENNIVSLPAFRGAEPQYGKNDKTILWIGRLVDFKFASLFSLLDFIRDNGSYHLYIVGDGDKDFFIQYVKANNIPMEKITMLGEVSYKDLPSVISKYAIGYAAGTSIIEIAQQGKPVIMALQANKTRKFKRDICGGVFYNTTKGNLGEDLCITEERDIKTTVADAVCEIERDYQLAAKRCFEYVDNEYNQEKNFEEYLTVVNSAPIYKCDDIKVPYCGVIRKFLYKHNLN